MRAHSRITRSLSIALFNLTPTDQYQELNVALKAVFSDGTKKNRRDVTEQEILKALGNKNAMNDVLEVPPAGDVAYSYRKSSDLFKFDVKGDWASVSEASITARTGERVILNDFVQVGVKFTVGDSDIAIRNAKRGEINTGSGEDHISIALLTNNDENNTKNSNNFVISTKAGDDVVTFTAGNENTAGNKKDGNGSWIYNPWDPDAGKKPAIVDGSLSYATINTGAGNDEVDLSAVKIKEAKISLGTGDDIARLGAGAETLIFKEGETGTDQIFGFDNSEDTFVLYGQASDWLVENTDGDTVLTNGGQIIIIRDVTLSSNDVADWF